MVAAALLDRLLHHAIVVQIEGSSYRLREHADLLPDHLRNRPSSLKRGETVCTTQVTVAATYDRLVPASTPVRFSPPPAPSRQFCDRRAFAAMISMMDSGEPGCMAHASIKSI